jgi:5'-nucleotidase
MLPRAFARRFQALIVSLALMFCAAASAQKPHRSVHVQLLAINDFHGNLEPPTGSDGLIDKMPAGGAEYLATHLRKAAAENPNTLVIGAGDMFGASPLLSGLFQDRPAIEALNAMHLSVTSIGNHELDHGGAELLRRVRGGCPQGNTCSAEERADAAKFQYLAGNVRFDRGPLFPAMTVRTIGGVKIGFIGETLQGTGTMLAEKSRQNLEFLEESAVANRAAETLERQGVHTIVLLIHQGGSQSAGGPNGDRDPNGCQNFSGGIEPILEHLLPSIKVVVSAHTHQFYNCTIHGRTVTSASSYGRMFTRIQLTIDAATDKLLYVAAANVTVTRDVAKDPEETAIIAKYLPRADELRNRVVGSTTAAISKKKNGPGESALGELIADAQLAATSAPANGGAVIAFMNSGGIRSDLVPASGEDAGPCRITYGQLYAAQPFGNRLTVFTLTGDMLRRILEQQFTGGTHELLQVSQGFSYKYRQNAPAGEHVVPGSITLHGRPIAPDERLRVEASDFIAQGSEGLTVFQERTDSVTGELDVDALVEYFASHSPVGPEPLNRIIRVD